MFIKDIVNEVRLPLKWNIHLLQIPTRRKLTSWLFTQQCFEHGTAMYQIQMYMCREEELFCLLIIFFSTFALIAVSLPVRQWQTTLLMIVIASQDLQAEAQCHGMKYPKILIIAPHQKKINK